MSNTNTNANASAGTSKIYVEVAIPCSRKGKTLNARVPHNEVEALVAGVDKRARNAQMMQEQFTQVPPDQLPHLIIVYKGQAVLLPTVHDSNDEAIKRALNAAIGSDAFDVPAPVKRKTGDKAAE